MIPVLYIIVPCFNEEAVLPLTSENFLGELLSLINKEKISPESRVLFVDDGSTDGTWRLIKKLSEQDEHFCGISLSRNCGHQNALFAGLMEAREHCDITISIDCDGQDDISAAEKMVDEYLSGSEVVYGVRSSRDSDTFFKRFTAESFYRLLETMGAEVVFNHADYRLVSSKALDGLSQFQEKNLYLRGIFPLIGFKSSTVEYQRHERLAGKTHYPLRKMAALAVDGVTSLSVKPLRIITVLGLIISVISFIGTIWAFVMHCIGSTVDGWASVTCIVCFLGGIQLVSLGVIGEYIGKIYMEVKNRPRYIISERTNEKTTIHK